MQGQTSHKDLEQGLNLPYGAYGYNVAGVYYWHCGFQQYYTLQSGKTVMLLPTGNIGKLPRNVFSIYITILFKEKTMEVICSINILICRLRYHKL